jgi:SAM-dependent methyltransferase
MRKFALRAYRCPATEQSLEINSDGRKLRTSCGRSYPINNGIIDFTHGLELGPPDRNARQSYDDQAGEHYSNSMAWLWRAFHENETEVRGTILDMLDIRAHQKILEVGCGTGSDSELIARRMNGGVLFLQDISRKMLRLCRSRLEKIPEPRPLIEYSVAATAPLPFVDGYFDRVFHFGGLNTFNDIAAALREMARVTKREGRIVVGDESLAPWLRDTDYGRIIINSNHLCAAPLALDKLPACARDVSLRFVIGNAYYAIAFTVGAGAPKIDLDLPHRGRRGGTLRTRYFGQLEGVSLEAKRLATEAAAARGKSMHDWLDEAVRKAAATDLKREGFGRKNKSTK